MPLQLLEESIAVGWVGDDAAAVGQRRWTLIPNGERGGDLLFVRPEGHAGYCGPRDAAHPPEPPLVQAIGLDLPVNENQTQQPQQGLWEECDGTEDERRAEMACAADKDQ